jgi:hypothetical protein
MGFLEGLATGASIKNNRELRRQQAADRNFALQQQGYSVDRDGNIVGIRPGSQAEVDRLKMEEMSTLLKSTAGKIAALESDQALEDYSFTGNANRFQQVLDNNPTLKNAWAERGVNMVTNLDFDNDGGLLGQAGIQPSMYDTPEKKDTIKKNIYKFYNGQEWQIGLGDKLAAETGSIGRLGERRAQGLINNKKNLVSLLTGPKGDPYAAEGHKYEKEIMAAAEKYDVPPNLIAAMIKQESNNDPNAISEKKARGLMQLLDGTAKDMGVTDITDPAQNIDGGTKYLKQQLDKYNGDLSLALAAYNAGPAKVDKYGGIPPYTETRNYVRDIMANIDQAESYYNSDAKSMNDTLVSKYQKIQDTILGDQAARAQAEGGVSPEASRAKILNDERIREQQDIQLRLQEENLNVQREQQDIQLRLQEENLNVQREKQDIQLRLQEENLNVQREKQDIQLRLQEENLNVQREQQNIQLRLQEENLNIQREKQNIQLRLQEENLNIQREKNKIEKDKLLQPKEDKPTSKSRDTQEAMKIDDKYLNKPVEEIDSKELQKDVQAQENLLGENMSEPTIKSLTNLRKTIESAKKTTGLSLDDTGVFSVTENTLGQYLFEGTDIKGVKARSAWSSIVGFYRREMAGLSQTTAEMENVKKEVGDLKENYPTVITKLVNLLENTKVELDVRSKTFTNAQSLLYLGSSKDELEKTIKSLNKLIGVVSGEDIPVENKLDAVKPELTQENANKLMSE